MTREEAKQVFLSRGFVKVDSGTVYDPDKWREACAVISDWLKQEPSEMTVEEYRQRMMQAFHNAGTDELIVVCVLPTAKEFEHLELLLKSHYKKEPCEDAISRKEVFETFGSVLGVWGRQALMEMKPVTPTRKKGKWEYVGDNCFKCSECGEVYTVDQFNHINNYCNNRFPKGCPNCGAEMGEEKCR